MKNKSEFEKTISLMDPVYDNQFEVIFPIENEVLSAMVKTISDGMLVFNMLIDETGRLIPLNELINLTKTNNQFVNQLKVNLHRQDGKTFLSTVYHDCEFYIHSDSLSYHNYSSDSVKELNVNFNFKKKSMFDENDKEIILNPNSI